MSYKFIVGVRPLSVDCIQAGGQWLLDQMNKLGHGPTNTEVCHAAILINKDIFEYDMKGWHRRKDVGRDADFNWDTLGVKIKGSTNVSPDQLEQIIKNDRQWEMMVPQEKAAVILGTTLYSLMTSGPVVSTVHVVAGVAELMTYNPYCHNCHHFVMFCLDKIGAGYFFKGYKQPFMKIFK